MHMLDLTGIPCPQPVPLGEGFGGTSPTGGSVRLTNQSMEKDGAPFFCISGEIHYCRVNPDQWEDTLVKARHGGVNLVSSYVFWNVHEEEQGRFRFDGCRNLRRFVSMCAEQGLMVILRIGPFAHGEMRNGGLPDWLYGMPFEVRSNDAGYLKCVRRLFAAIHSQVDGLYFSQGGPVVGIQLENEYMHSSAPWEFTAGISDEWVNPGRDGEEHIRALKKIAQEEGLVTPFYTCTAWGGAMAPADSVLPLWGGYAYWPWIFYKKGGEHPCTPEYLYRNNHSNAVRSTYNFAPRYLPESMPYACCEMMGGMMCSVNYRFALPYESVDALANVKLGSGCSMLGYYMYRGGTTPSGRRTPFLNEGQVCKKSYDYQAPIGEFGQLRPSWYRLRTLHDFCRSFSGRVLGSVTVLENDRDDGKPEDRSALRFCARVRGEAGFLFVNNFQDHLTLPERRDETVRLRLADRDVDIPVNLAPGENAVLPFGFRMGDTMLDMATVQPVTRLVTDGQPVWFFMIPEGSRPMMRFSCAAGCVFSGIGAEQDNGSWTVRPETDGVTSFRVNGQQVVVMTRQTALGFSHFSADGREVAVLSDSAVFWDGGQASIECCGEDQAVMTMPPLRDSRIRKGPFGGRIVRAPAVPVFKPEAVQTGSCRWTVRIPPAVLKGHKTVILSVVYLADIGQAFVNGRMISDNFCNGQPWEIRLDCWRRQLAEHPLTIYLAPVRKEASVRVDSAMAARWEEAKETAAVLKKLEIRFVDTVRFRMTF